MVFAAAKCWAWPRCPSQLLPTFALPLGGEMPPLWTRCSHYYALMVLLDERLTLASEKLYFASAYPVVHCYTLESVWKRSWYFHLVISEKWGLLYLLSLKPKNTAAKPAVVWRWRDAQNSNQWPISLYEFIFLWWCTFQRKNVFAFTFQSFGQFFIILVKFKVM